MRKRLTLLSLLLSFVLIVSACGGNGGNAGGNAVNGNASNGGSGENGENAAEQEGDAKTVELVMGTGSQGGTYFPLGNEMARVWNNNIENVNVTATETGASLENLGAIGQGEMDLGMTVHIPAVQAVNGTGPFEGAKADNVAFLAHIYPEVFQIITREGSGIDSVADLAGKKVAIGPPGSGSQAASKLILKAFGIEDGEYQAYQEGFGDAKTKIQDGVIDASMGFLGVPNASINQLQAAAGDVKLVNITGEGLEKLQEISGYKPYTIKAGSYDWLEEDVQTVAGFAVLVANTDTVDNETAYQLVKVMFEQADKNTHAQSKYFTHENALKGGSELPMHPGAEKYFKEIGLIE